MNKWRQRHQDHGKAVKKSRPDDDGGSHETELSDSAESVYSEAKKHRAGVIKRDAAKARRNKGRG